ncbi:UNVERIFIED_CONTAM: Endonuclease MutS2 [Sesamum radiatum]|uniref:Endonuclease MutS2 n=1 Tax=Sesamum radiatum TaxID=300843 RepID=A0AAW2K1K0_SESRA
MALVTLLQFADALQLNVKAAIKEDSDWFRRFMPLSEMSANLRHARDQVRFLERKEICNLDGRWCIKSGAVHAQLLRDCCWQGVGSVVEPLSAVPLNDELQQARASAAKAEAEMQVDLDEIEHVFNIMIQIDMEIRRRKQLRGLAKGEEEKNLNSLQMQVAKLKKALPVPFDIFIAQNTRVLVITGPNTGGKTICLKTVGLAAMMAKSGLYVLASEPARIPWFDFVLADIGDEQSLSQSLSTFSGHLKQISEIRSLSTSLSLVLLDEVGAGTNPLEGAALGMSLLESFADGGALLTIATTHHGELKTLKYSNNAFENACMEFDEVNLKPTYRILWGVPGRSNAINIAERLGLPVEILDNARELYGAASAEINEVIVDMERFKQDYHNKIHEAQHYMRLSRKLHQSLLLTRKRVMEHGMEERYRMMQEISEAAASARSITHKKVRESRSVRIQPSKQIKADKDSPSSTPVHLHAPAEKNGTSPATDTACSMDNTKPSITDKKLEFQRLGTW